MRPRSKMERETVILRNGVDRDWQLTTDDPRVIRMLEKRGHTGVPLGQECRRYQIPKGCLRLQKVTVSAARPAHRNDFRRKPRALPEVPNDPT